MITLFGAAGTTGRMVAQSLDAAGFAYRLAGRSKEELSKLSAELNSHPAYLLADARCPETLPALMKDTQILINTVGPFTDLGEKLVSMAAVSGVHYLDSSNELGFAYRAQTYGRLAAQNSAALVTSCAFETSFADCAANLMAKKIKGPFRKIDIVYHQPGKNFSRGTRMSAIRSLATSWITYRDSGWTGEVPGRQGAQFSFSTGQQDAVSLPGCESITLPAHVAVSEVRVWRTGYSRLWGPLFLPFYARSMRSILGPVVVRAKSHTLYNSANPSPFEILLLLENEKATHSMSIQGNDPYLLTAKILTYAAGRLLSLKHPPKGYLAPAQLLEPAAFLQIAYTDWGVSFDPLSFLNHAQSHD